MPVICDTALILKIGASRGASGGGAMIWTSLPSYPNLAHGSRFVNSLSVSRFTFHSVQYIVRSKLIIVLLAAVCTAVLVAGGLWLAAGNSIADALRGVGGGGPRLVLRP